MSEMLRNELAGDPMARIKWGKKRRKRITIPKLTTEGDDIALSGPFANRSLAEIFHGREFGSADFRDFKLIDLATAEEIAKVKSIQKLSVWNKITRPAFSKLMKTPGLKEAIVLEFRGFGRMRDFEHAIDVETFRSFHPLATADITQVVKLPKLHTLVAHSAEFGLKATDKIQAVETLRSVDFESLGGRSRAI